MNHSDSESGSDYQDWHSEDDNVGDTDWEFSHDARDWEIRRLRMADEKIKLWHEDEALQAIRFLFVEEEEEEEEEEELWYVRCLPNWDELTHQSDPEWSSDSETNAYPEND